MELESTTCCGCLSTNRKVETINDFMIKKCYSNIINEIPALNHNGFPISLCWLCAALLKKFTRFKHQVLQSYQALQECSKMNFRNVYHSKLTHQKLQIQKVIDITITPEDTLVDKDCSVDLVKTEYIEPEERNEGICIKEEIDSFDDDDDMALIEMADKKKKNTKSSSKKRRKQKQKTEAEMFTEIELTGAQLEAERRLSRDKEEYVNAMFRCEKCILPFPNADDFKDHMKLKHELIGTKAKKPCYKYCTVPKCKNNNKSTPDKVFFHVPKDVKMRKQWCQLMRRTKVSAQSSLHCCEDHFDNRLKYKCPICEVSLATLVSYSYHRNKHVMRYECTVCTQRFTSKRMAGKHYEASHSLSYHRNKHVMRYECTVCTQRFTSKRMAGKHYEASHRLRTKERKNSHTNQNGDGSLENVDNSQEDSAKSEASFPCEFCDKTFRWSTSLRKHVETHKIESGQKRKPYCETCKLSFTNTSNLQKHVKSSSKHQIQLRLMKLNESALEPSQPGAAALEQQVRRAVNVSRALHACAHCGARYQWRGNLLRHLHTHAARAKGELVCAPCNRTFSSIATYQQHMKISKKHVSENDFKFMCSECGKKFANKTRLKDHVNWEHLKNYVHNCHLCQKVFKSHTSLYLHKQVVHKKDNTDHLCDHCGKPFPNQAKLRCHVAALHSGEAPYKCSSCAARFSWHSCLSRHVRRVHNKRHVS